MLPQPPSAPRDPISPFDPASLPASANLTDAAFTAHNPFSASGVNFANPAFSFSSAYLTEDGGAAAWIGAPTAPDPFPALEEVADPSNLAIVGASSDLSTIYFEYYGTLTPETTPVARSSRVATSGPGGCTNGKGDTSAWRGYSPPGKRIHMAP